MRIGVVGISYKSSSLSLREMLARAFKQAFDGACDMILLSTCNRTELYFCAQSPAEKHIHILGQLRMYIEESFEHALYSYFGRDCFYHLCRVISGIDSAIFGESEIQRQAKCSYETARKKGRLSHELHYLFQKGLKIGKEIRTSFLLANKGKALPQAIQLVLNEHQKKLPHCRVLFIGNSAINRQLIPFFEQKGCVQITLCTRMLQGVFPSVDITHWEELKKWSRYDIVVCGTHHKRFIIDAPQDNRESVLLFDLSVPRNVNPILGEHPCIQLYNIDQLMQFVCKKKDAEEIALCENSIQKAAARQMQLFNERRQAKWRYASGQ